MSDNYIPQISQLGGFPRLSSIRLPDFFPRWFMASVNTDIADEVTDSANGAGTSGSEHASIRPLTSSTSSNSLWTFLHRMQNPDEPLPDSEDGRSSHEEANDDSDDVLFRLASSASSSPSSSVPKSSFFAGSPLSSWRAPTFSFPRHLANYLFPNIDEDEDLDSGNGTDTSRGRRLDSLSNDMDKRSSSMGDPAQLRQSMRRRRARRRRRQKQQQLQEQLAAEQANGADDPGTAAAAADIGVDVVLSEEKERELRQKIKEIQDLEIAEREKAVRMHAVMTEEYYRLRGGTEGAGTTDSEAEDSELDDDLYDEEEAGLTAEDKKDTWYDEETGVRGCKHYQRGVKLMCSQCSQWYPCRFCHDEVETSHKLIRYETVNMLCMSCLLPQPAAQFCSGCNVRVSRYYCEICKLWDDDPTKSIYHCADCGICRIGEGLGKDFFHCKTCNVCMSIALENSHRCIEHVTECNCPICGEYMFTSTETVVFMRCGHSIHQSCFYEHTRNSYKCPTCARSVVNMESQFRLLDREIERQVLPEPYSHWRSVISCNDCSAKCNVPFHFLGLRCDMCKSYNTALIKLIKPEEGTDAASIPFDDDPEARAEAERLFEQQIELELERQAREIDGDEADNHGEGTGNLFPINAAARQLERLSMRVRTASASPARIRW
ncbi:uncharacterized protein V1516DRAFT_622694 [Lipomyces oligophaga]|uniref:uncharacterized protein n=1 Tax=Lipomyces oligophaga TaxID=45792 RepID=UPI0034CF6FDD